MATEEIGIPEVPIRDVIPGIDDTNEIKLEGFSFYSDGTPIITKGDVLSKLRDGAVATDSSKYAINLFLKQTDNPEKLKSIAEEFMFEGFGYNVQSGEADSPIFIRNGVIKVGSDKAKGSEMSVIELSPRTCDQFLGVFLSETTIFPPFEEELSVMSDLAIRSYTDGAFSLALYDHLIVSRWLTDGTNSTRDYLRYTRAAKALMNNLIGDNEFAPPDLETVRHRLAGGIAYNRMMERMRSFEYFQDGPYEERIDTFRAKLALRAIRATHDDFFIGVASPLGTEEQEAYIATAARMSSPRIRR